MKTNLIALSAVLIALTGNSWADSLTTPNTFSSGTPAKADEVNANFAAVEKAVDDIGNSLVILPAGVETRKTVYIRKPGNYDDTMSTTVTMKPIISGCRGSNVRINVKSYSYNLGDNVFFYLPPVATDKTISIPPGGLLAGTYLATDSWTRSGMGDMLALTVYRIGDHAEDTCTTDIRLWGVDVIYPYGSFTKQLFVTPKEFGN